MPCTGCGNTDYMGTIKVRYTGKKGDKGSYTHETGRTYTKPARYANKEAYPLFELVAVMPGTVIPDKYRFIEKRTAVPIEMIPAPTVEDEPEPESEEKVEEEEAETFEEAVFIEVDPIEPEEEIPVIEESEQVSSIVDASVGLNQSDIISGMDVRTVRAYIEANEGTVDNRWGLKRLIEEAQKLQ